MFDFKISKPWIAVTILLVAVIWGNSFVPGEGSGSFSLAVMQAVQGFLAGLHVPYEWVTNFLIRKLGHFTEYMLLGISASRALCLQSHNAQSSYRHGINRAVFNVAYFLLVVPMADETIQYFIPGRSAQVTDVILDCCGAAVGVLINIKLLKGKMITAAED